MAALMLPLLLADGLPSLAVLMFVAYMATAPTMITGMTLVQQLVPLKTDQRGHGAGRDRLAGR